MKAPFFRGWLLAATCAGLVCAASLNAEPAATSPWTKVPALPTACYYNGDPVVEKLQAAYDSISADHQRQNDINAQIRDDFNNVDPMEMARRMQENMMKDPQNAAKYRFSRRAPRLRPRCRKSTQSRSSSTRSRRR
jgi:hypothetical protein